MRTLVLAGSQEEPGNQLNQYKLWEILDRVFAAMVQTTEHLYIVRDEQILSGEPIVKGTRTSV